MLPSASGSPDFCSNGFLAVHFVAPAVYDTVVLGESFLRASLLPLVGQGIGGEGVAGRLGAMQLDVVVEGALVTAASPLSEVSAGKIGTEASGNE